MGWRIHAPTSPAIMQPTSEGVNSRTVCQPRVVMLLWPAQREDTSTMGPGSRYRRTWLTGKSLFSGCFGIGVLSRAPLCSDILGRFEVVRERALRTWTMHGTCKSAKGSTSSGRGDGRTALARDAG